MTKLAISVTCSVKIGQLKSMKNIVKSASESLFDGDLLLGQSPQ